MPESIKICNSGNFAVDICKIVYFDGWFEYEMENQRGIIYNLPYTCRDLLQDLCQCLRRVVDLLHVIWHTILLLVLKVLGGRLSGKYSLRKQAENFQIKILNFFILLLKT